MTDWFARPVLHVKNVEASFCHPSPVTSGIVPFVPQFHHVHETPTPGCCLWLFLFPDLMKLLWLKRKRACIDTAGLSS